MDGSCGAAFSGGRNLAGMRLSRPLQWKFRAVAPARRLGGRSGREAGPVKGGLRQANWLKKRSGQVLPGSGCNDIDGLRLPPPMCSRIILGVHMSKDVKCSREGLCVWTSACHKFLPPFGTR